MYFKIENLASKKQNLVKICRKYANNSKYVTFLKVSKICKNIFFYIFAYLSCPIQIDVFPVYNFNLSIIVIQNKYFILQTKRPRLLSDSEGDSPTKAVTQPPSNNGYGFSGIPSPDIVQKRLDLLTASFPNRDRMDLQDALKSCDWSLVNTMSKLKNDMKSVAIPMSQKFANLPKKHRVKAHEAAVEFSDSESDSEEYKDNKKVFDSDSDAEEEEIDENRLPDDKKRVLAFFNDGTSQELSAIQGCSKKKAEYILKMRPYEGWSDLVTKVQGNKQLSTDMLNNTTMLLKMRDAVQRLMDKCEKITEKMTKMVENLTSDRYVKTQYLKNTKDPKIFIFQIHILFWRNNCI